MGVSRDDVKRHKKFIEKQSLNFSLLSDEDGSITDAFGVWQKKLAGREYMGIATLSLCLVTVGSVSLYIK